MSYERPYYKDLNYRPLLFYAVFGVGDAHVEVSKERHRIDEFPEGLGLFLYDKADGGQRDYMDSLIGGSFGSILNARWPELYQAVRQMDKWAVIRGEAQKDEDLHYMRNTIGFVQALAEDKGVASYSIC